MREDRNPISMMLGTSTAWMSLLLPYHDNLSQGPHTAQFSLDGNFWEKASVCRHGWPRSRFGACAEAATL